MIQIFSAPGDLDTTFNATGLQPGTTATKINNWNYSNEANSIVIQADGKIVAAGFAYSGLANQFALARFNSDGSLDTTFNSAGVEQGTTATTINGWNYDNEASSVALQADGKIVTAGRASNGSYYQFAAARFNSDGTIDSTFNPLGVQQGTKATTINNWNYYNGANAIAIQADGKIVAAGYTTPDNGTTYQFALARFNTDGSLDTTFSPAGVEQGTTATTINNWNHVNRAYSVAIQPDGKIVAAGYASNGSYSQFALARFNSDGSLDSTFNPSGAQRGTTVTTINGWNYSSGANSVAIQADGKIVVAGFAFDGTSYYFALARFNPDGSIDTTFNPLGLQPGTTSTTINGWNYHNQASSVALQADGKIVAVGYARNASNIYYFAVVRFNSNGSLDTTFNPAGVEQGTTATTINNWNYTNDAYSVAIQPDGKIVAAGYTTPDNGATYQFALARFIGEYVAAPTNLTAQKIYHRFPTQVDIINQLCWDAVVGAVAYNIYADAELTISLATIASPTVCYAQHQICAGQTTTYYVTAVDVNGIESAPASIAI